MPNPTPPSDPVTSFAIKPADPVDVRGALRALWHGKYMVLCTIVVLTLAAGYHGFFVDAPRYAARTTLHFVPAPLVASPTAPVTQPHNMDKIRRNTEMQMMQSRHLLVKVISDLGLRDDPVFNRYLIPANPWSLTGLRAKARHWITGQVEPQPTDAQIIEKTIDNLTATVSVRGVRDTDIVEIQATTRDPEQAVRIANALADAYLADQISAKQDTAERTVVWLSDRVVLLQDELGQKEREITRLVGTSGGETDRQLDALGARIGRTEQQIQDTERALQEAEQALNATQAVQVLSSTDQAKLQADVVRYATRSAALQGFQADLNDKLASHSADMLALQQLRREAAATRVVYDSFLTRLQETSLHQQGEASDSRVLTYAIHADYAGPYKLLTLQIAALVGLCLSVTAILVRHFTRTGFNTGVELEFDTGYPVVADIPELPSQRPKGFVTHLLKHPDGALATAYRQLRTHLLSRAAPHVVVSTGCDQNVNATPQTLGLAMAMARLDRSVLVIDLGGQNRNASKYFRGESCNLTQVIDGVKPLKEAITLDHRTQVDLLLHQDATSSPADIVGRLDFDIFLKSLKAQYDVIIFNAGPVIHSPEAAVLAQKADTTLLAVAWRRSKLEQVQEAQRLLRAGDIALTLCAVNIRHQRRLGTRPRVVQNHAPQPVQ